LEKGFLEPHTSYYSCVLLSQILPTKGVNVIEMTEQTSYQNTKKTEREREKERRSLSLEAFSYIKDKHI
jgi:hypothetical protein